ncbi:MAG: hypothetical protein D6785_06115 [Planctomycetota bacterium]|nr:MAG: hypothetical protein D6785_06115 [Planctomycetota bacterium]
MSPSLYLFCEKCNVPYQYPSSTSSHQNFRCRFCHGPLVLRERKTTGSTQLPSEGEPISPLSQKGKLTSGGPLPAGTKLLTLSGNQYEILSVLGQGGAGRVYEVRDPFLKRPMALKILLESKQNDTKAKQRFLREILVTSLLEHPNIPPLYEAGYLRNGQPYMLMKKIKGGTFKDLLVLDPKGNPKVPLRKHLEIFLKVCHALQYAHTKGVIHRDLKPSNIAIGDFGEVLVMDWGLAKILSKSSAKSAFQNENVLLDEKELAGSHILDSELSMDSGVMGTPAYMPPEQANGQNHLVGPWSDVYSLGAVLYHILTLVPPFQGSAREVLTSLLLKDPLPPRIKRPSLSIPRELDAITMKCLSKNTNHRYPNVQELIKDVEAYLDDLPISIYTPPPLERAKKWMKKHVGILAASLAITLIVAVLGYLLALTSHQKVLEHQRTIALKERMLKSEKEKELLYQQKLKAEQEKREQEKKIYALQKEREERQKKLLKAYGPYMLARNLMAQNLRFRNLEQKVLPLLQKTLKIYPQFLEARIDLIKLYIYLNYHQHILGAISAMGKNMPKEQQKGFRNALSKIMLLVLTKGGSGNADLPPNIDQWKPPGMPRIYWESFKIYLLFGIRNYQQTIQQIEKVRSIPGGDNWELLYIKGVCFRRLGKVQKALQIYDQLIREYPHIVFPYSNKAYVLLIIQNRVTEGLRVIKRAMMVDFSYPFIWETLGIYYRNRGESLNIKEYKNLKLRCFLAGERYFGWAYFFGKRTFNAKNFFNNRRKLQKEIAYLLGFSKDTSPKLWVPRLFHLAQKEKLEFKKEVALHYLSHLKDYKSIFPKYLFQKYAKIAFQYLFLYKPFLKYSVDEQEIRAYLSLKKK